MSEEQQREDEILEKLLKRAREDNQQMIKENNESIRQEMKETNEVFLKRMEEQSEKRSEKNEIMLRSILKEYLESTREKFIADMKKENSQQNEVADKLIEATNEMIIMKTELEDLKNGKHQNESIKSNRRSSIMPDEVRYDENNLKQGDRDNATVVSYQDTPVPDDIKLREVTVKGVIYVMNIAAEWNDQHAKTQKKLSDFISRTAKQNLIKNEILKKVPNSQLLNIQTFNTLSDQAIKEIMSRAVSVHSSAEYRDVMLYVINAKIVWLRLSAITVRHQRTSAQIQLIFESCRYPKGVRAKKQSTRFINVSKCMISMVFQVSHIFNLKGEEGVV